MLNCRLLEDNSEIYVLEFYKNEKLTSNNKTKIFV